MNSSTSRLGSPRSYWETKDCGFPRISATSAGENPMALLELTNRSHSALYSGVKMDFFIRSTLTAWKYTSHCPYAKTGYWVCIVPLTVARLPVTHPGRRGGPGPLTWASIESRPRLALVSVFAASNYFLRQAWVIHLNPNEGPVTIHQAASGVLGAGVRFDADPKGLAILAIELFLALSDNRSRMQRCHP